MKKKYPRYFAVDYDRLDLKFVILEDETGFGRYVYRDGSNVFVHFSIEDLKRNHRETPIEEAVLM